MTDIQIVTDFDGAACGIILFDIVIGLGSKDPRGNLYVYYARMGMLLKLFPRCVIRSNEDQRKKYKANLFGVPFEFGLNGFGIAIISKAVHCRKAHNKIC